MNQENLSGLSPNEQFDLKTVFAELSELAASLDEIPESEPLCYFCHAETKKGVVTYQYYWELGGDTMIAICKNLPGYRCENDQCGQEYVNSNLHDKFISATAEGLTRLGYSRLKETLQLSKQDPLTYTAFSPIPASVESHFNT